jgi:lipoate-protein ligase B
MATLKNYNLDCSNKSQSVANDENQTGVWINDKKIASIGIAVKSWISYHGIAINVHADPEAFVGINPCGYSPNIMTSMQDQLQRPVDLSELKNIFYKTWVDFFDPLSADAKKNC